MKKMVKNSIVLGIILLFVGTSVVPHINSEKIDFKQSGISISTRQNIVYVNDDYNETTPNWNVTHFDKIQEGINAVNETGIVYVCNGTYYENIIIEKELTLMGVDEDGWGNDNFTIIDGRENDSILFINISNVKISGFIIVNSSWVAIKISNSQNIEIFQNTIINSQYCIVSHNSNNIKIFRNIFINNSECIEIDKSVNTLIHNNSFLDNQWGLTICGNSFNIIVRDNDFRNIEYDSVFCTFSNSNYFLYNNFTDCGIGIQLYQSNDNSINFNRFINSKTGITASGSDFNLITWNFIQGGGNIENITGIFLLEGGSNRILNNRISYNVVGLWLRYLSGNNDIQYNCIEDNGIGIQIQNSKRREFIRYNNIMNNEIRDMVALATIGWYPFNYWGRWRPFQGQIFRIGIVIIFPPWPKEFTGICP